MMYIVEANADRAEHLFFEGMVVERFPPTRPGTSSIAIGASPTPSQAEWPARGSDESDFYAWLFRRGGMRVDHYRRTSLDRRLHACLRVLGVRSIEEARARIESDPSHVHRAIDAVLLGVTEFSRDAIVFESLRREILPAFRTRSGPIRMWSAACSDGQELYSVAILLADAGLLGRCELRGTDCRPDAIAQARAGEFSTEALEKLSPDQRLRFFITAGPRARACDELRRAIQWNVSDLFAGPEPGPWDLILWRNMAIYLTPESADLCWRGITRHLRVGGHLIVGKADHPPAGLGLHRVSSYIYQKA